MASGDIRTNGDKYVYEIQLSGIRNSSIPECSGANICQVKTNEHRFRRIGSTTKARYYVEGKYLLINQNCLMLHMNCFIRNGSCCMISVLIHFCKGIQSLSSRI